LIGMLKDSRGIALLTVMIIMSVILIILSLLFNMVIQERLMTNDYTDRKQAYYIAEAAADQAINTFIEFINDLHDDNTYVTFTTSTENIKVNINNPGDYANSFQYKLDNGTDSAGNPRYDMEKKFRDALGTNDISIQYTGFSGCDSNGYLHDYDDESARAYGTLTINIEATYRGEVYPYQLRLRFCRHGAVYEYKGEGEW